MVTLASLRVVSPLTAMSSYVLEEERFGERERYKTKKPTGLSRGGFENSGFMFLNEGILRSRLSYLFQRFFLRGRGSY